MPLGRRTTGQSRPGSGTQFDRPGHPVCAVPSQLPLLTRAPSNGNERGPINPAAGTKKAAHSWTATDIVPDFGTNDKTEHLFHSLRNLGYRDTGPGGAYGTVRPRGLRSCAGRSACAGDRSLPYAASAWRGGQPALGVV